MGMNAFVALTVSDGGKKPDQVSLPLSVCVSAGLFMGRGGARGLCWCHPGLWRLVVVLELWIRVIPSVRLRLDHFDHFVSMVSSLQPPYNRCTLGIADVRCFLLRVDTFLWNGRGSRFVRRSRRC